MPDRIYKRMDIDNLTYLFQYLFMKLKDSPLADNTTYTLIKSGNGVALKDNNGEIISNINDIGKIYSAVTEDGSEDGLMTPSMLQTLNELQKISEGTITSIKVNGESILVSDGSVDITVPISKTYNPSFGNNGEMNYIGGESVKYYVDPDYVGHVYNSLNNKITTTSEDINAGIDLLSEKITNLEGAGYQTADDVNSAILEKSYQTSSDVESAITSKGYQTENDVIAAIQSANHISKMIVLEIDTQDNEDGTATLLFRYNTLDGAIHEETALENVIYMVPAKDANSGNVYEEYMVINSKWEKIGSTDVDLTGYVKETDFCEISKDKVAEIVNNAFNSIFTQ